MQNMTMLNMTKLLHRFILSVITCALFSCAVIAQSRDQIRVVGSSTVFPFSTAVAEEFGRSSRYKTPIIEATGTGGGFKLFCSGIGTKYPDITNASRPIKISELTLCKNRGINEVAELKIGYDGIVLAQKKQGKKLSLTVRELYLALAAKVPSVGTNGGLNTLIANPYNYWDEINPSLPHRPILVIGPPPTSGTRDSFNELAIQVGCNSFSANKSIQKNNPIMHQAVCQAIREDGRYIEFGENDNLIIQKIQANKDAIGIFGYSFLDQNTDTIEAIAIGQQGISAKEPNFETISNGDYPISRSLYIYIKKAHINIIPGITNFIKEFTHDRTAGELGYLADHGLVPLLSEERQEANKQALHLLPIEGKL